MTTTDYLESLQEDLNKINNSLNLEEGTNFTDIANMAENGDISTGGGADLSEYFYTELTSNTDVYHHAKIVKKFAPIIVDNNVTSLTYAFSNIYGADSLPKVICGNNVTTMNYMYANDKGDRDINITKSIDVSGLDTSNVTNMSNMFYNLPNLENIVGLTNFNTSNATNMSSMFYYTGSTGTIDISSFDTSNVTNMRNMFANMSMQIIFGNKFNTSNVTGEGLYGMFFANTNITSLPPITVTSKITSLANLFFSCTQLQSLVFPETWDTSNVTNMYQMCSKCINLKTFDLSNCVFEKAPNISYMLNQCTSLQFADLRSLDFTKIINYANMFGSGVNSYVPANCEIIVADQTQKDWMNIKFARLTNVKTVAEYEAEQSE